MPSVRTGWVWVLGVATLVAGGCLPSEKADFDAPGPSRRLEAIVRASGSDADPRSLPRLVEQLDSQDAAARMLAIRALEHRTGTTLGYNHTDPEWKRQEAIERWLNYLEQGAVGSDVLYSAGGQP
jgi:hypothetical protein